MRLHRKAEMGIVVILVVVILLFAIGYVINIGNRECNDNKDCGSESYCGSDFACHSYPTIEKTIIENNYLVPSILIALAIVIAAMIFRWNELKPRKEKIVEEQKAEAKPEIEDITEPYYKSNNNIKLNYTHGQK